MIIIIKGAQRVGKSTVGVGLVLHCHLFLGYELVDINANTHLYRPDGSDLPDYTYLTNVEMRNKVGEMVKNGMRRKIFYIDEIDRVFPHRFWNRFGQSEALLGLWQDEKLENIIIGTTHKGKGIDLMIRESMHYEIFVELDKSTGIADLDIISVNDMELLYFQMFNVPLIQALFKTREAIV